MWTRRDIVGRFVAVALAATSWSSAAWANPSQPPGASQGATVASVQGVVTRASDGQLLNRVSVTLRSETQDDFIRVHATNRDGAFTFEALPAGVYSLEATHEGFERVTVEPLLLLDGAQRTEHLTLREARTRLPAS